MLSTQGLLFGAALAFSGSGRANAVYVDGFNLYYGALKGSPFKADPGCRGSIGVVVIRSAVGPPKRIDSTRHAVQGLKPAPVPRTQSRSRARTGVMTFLCQPLQVFIETHPSMEDFDDFERVRLLAQDQEM